jgi:hypothetical protein
MTQDPMVAEVRAVRDQLFKECDYRLDKAVAYLHRQRKQLGWEVVRLPPQRPAVDSGRTEEPGAPVRKADVPVSKNRPISRASIRKRKAI